MSPQQNGPWRAQHPETGHTGDPSARSLLDEPFVEVERTGRVGERLARGDARAKVEGRFAYASDLRVDGMLHGATVRSPHAAARIVAIDTAAARAADGVHAVLTHTDVPGAKLVGSVLPDQPVLAFDEVRYHGEPVAIVAADSPRAARRAAALVHVEYELVEPVTDPATAVGARALHPGGNEVRSVRIRHGDPEAEGPVVVRGTYAVGMQDQAFLGPEAGLAIPDGAGGIELHVATQWLHVDRDQVAAGLGLRPDQVKLVLAGVGGAFGGREDLSIQLHACMLALTTGRPVRMAYGREESFVGHVHRHPAWMEYEHHAAEDGTLVAVRARLLLDGGAYASSSPAVIANATTLAVGPYRVPNAQLDGSVVYSNNPPCGAMRGFGAVQVAVAYEAQMDRLAEALAMDPVELRRRNALRTGDTLPFGQAVTGPVATEELLDRLEALPLPVPRSDARARPGGAFRPGDGETILGVGYAAGFKNIAFSEGFDDASTARVRLSLVDGRPVAEVHTGAAEVGQGVLGVQEQIARTELGVDDVRILPADTAVDSAGSASASRLSWLAGGAVQGACVAVRTRLEQQLAAVPDRADDGEAVAAALADGPIDETFTYRHRQTGPMDPETGQGEVHAGFAFVAHRAVVEVDPELGLVRVVELACAQDVGRALNPLALEGQLEGGSIQGLGLALSEELLVADGIVQTTSLGGYRIPTIVDAAPVPSLIVENADPDTPYGLKGAGELPSISSTPAILAALRAATGNPLTRAPVRPEDLT